MQYRAAARRRVGDTTRAALLRFPAATVRAPGEVGAEHVLSTLVPLESSFVAAVGAKPSADSEGRAVEVLWKQPRAGRHVGEQGLRRQASGALRGRRQLSEPPRLDQHGDEVRKLLGDV